MSPFRSLGLAAFWAPPWLAVLAYDRLAVVVPALLTGIAAVAGEVARLLATRDRASDWAVRWRCWGLFFAASQAMATALRAL